MGEKVLVIRPLSGISGDMLLSGFALLNNLTSSTLNSMLNDLKLSSEANITLKEKYVKGVRGYITEVNVPQCHTHRGLAEIQNIINISSLSQEAKKLAIKAFKLLAETEAAIHGCTIEEIHFHEVGAIDSIIDIALVCELYTRITPLKLICGPLPLADGSIKCAHGIITSPSPAVLSMLEGITVSGYDGQGETVTPTGLSLLKTLPFEFNKWPTMDIKQTYLIYGSKVFDNAPNGCIWAMGVSNTR